MQGDLIAHAARQQRPDLQAIQLPFVAGEQWLGLPLAEPGKVPANKTSLVLHLPFPVRPADGLAGLVIDEWAETIPSAEATTGVAFQYQNPGARPPQAILLALAPEGKPAWDLATLEATLLDTLELARLRAVNPKALAAEQELPHILPALYFGLNLNGDAISTDFKRLAP